MIWAGRDAGDFCTVAEKKKSFCISTKFLKINNKNCVEAVFVGHLGIRKKTPTGKPGVHDATPYIHCAHV